jgi:hypothetical protein
VKSFFFHPKTLYDSGELDKNGKNVGEEQSMADTIYFQWQNEVLLRTIYPLREMKLRDFLVYYKEIDLWAEYKDKDVSSLASDIAEYENEQKRAVVTAYKSYTSSRAYFLRPDVRADYIQFRPMDETELAKINALHETFITYLSKPNMADVRKEKYFVTERVYEWEAHRNEKLREAAQKQRRINSIRANNPNHPNLPKEEQELQTMQKVTVAMAEAELARLYSFVSSFNKIEKRKLELYKSKQTAEGKKREISIRLDDLRPQLERQEARQKELSDALARLKTPPNPASVEGYFSTLDVSAQIRRQYPQAEQSLIDMINGLHKDLSAALKNTKETASKMAEIKNQFYKMDQTRRDIEKEIAKHEADLRNMPKDWKYRAEREARLKTLKEINIKVIAAEAGRLDEYHAGLGSTIKSKEEMAKAIADKEKELSKAQADLLKSRSEAADLEKQLKSLDLILNASEEEYLVQYVPDHTPTVQEIVMGKVEKYKAGLASKNQFQLLEEIVERFKKEPKRYPLWLQYMVIHFSGMRYASAHGSWADPKDLLASLRTADIDRDFKKLDDDAVEALCQEKLRAYEPAPGIPAPGQLPKLAQTKDKQWLDKIAIHVKRMKSPSPTYRRQGLLGLRFDEENYDIELMTPKEAEEALEAIKDTLPDWMWKEIVKLTDLRMKQVKDPNWEKLTPEEQEERNSREAQEYRRIMDEWKAKHLTGWREEHDRSSQLIVTRAVCNEVAEHIQHLRGHSPNGGLTAKAPWYQKMEKEKKIPGNPPPYFRRPDSAEDYTVGASILWLRFVNEMPNAWRIAKPLKTAEGGYGLIPAEFLGKKPTASGAAGGWVYDTGDAVHRYRDLVDANKKKTRQDQWLRWIHEATVAEVAETAEGTVVLTFETALPYEDPRLSSVGIFKHYLNNIVDNGGEENYNGSFVGYVPEGRVPMEELKDMLDWNKVLLK